MSRQITEQRLNKAIHTALDLIAELQIISDLHREVHKMCPVVPQAASFAEYAAYEQNLSCYEDAYNEIRIREHEYSTIRNEFAQTMCEFPKKIWLHNDTHAIRFISRHNIELKDMTNPQIIYRVS